MISLDEMAYWFRRLSIALVSCIFSLWATFELYEMGCEGAASLTATAFILSITSFISSFVYFEDGLE